MLNTIMAKNPEDSKTAQKRAHLNNPRSWKGIPERKAVELLTISGYTDLRKSDCPVCENKLKNGPEEGWETIIYDEYGGTKKGSPDFIARDVTGKTCFFEIKSNKDKIREDQTVVITELRKMGFKAKIIRFGSHTERFTIEIILTADEKTALEKAEDVPKWIWYAGCLSSTHIDYLRESKSDGLTKLIHELENP